MLHPLARARRLAPALLLLALAGCTAETKEQRIAAHQQAIDPPALWRVESYDHDGHVSGALEVCADTTVREGFGRAGPEINGQPCVNLRGGVERPGLYAVRCQVAGRRYGVTVNKAGDPDRNFTAAIAVTALDGSGVAARQVRRFVRLGDCPAGWTIGDQARLDGSRGVNALAGTWADAR
ncbi:MAG: hypothetical protein DI570_20710 [Phenylobacterium zucineum]|nr:MAG: hypothetical protein DI570_20710 [Phenylobacterium zucineum]